MTADSSVSSNPGSRAHVAEPTLNEWVAQWLNTRGARPWEATAEELGAVVGGRAQLDLVVRQLARMPAVVEFEVGGPAVADAQSRIGRRLHNARRELTEVLAVGYSTECRTDDIDSFFRRMSENESFMTVQIVSRRNGGDASCRVWPDKPLRANASDLMAFIEYLQVPQAVIDEQSEHTASEIEWIGGWLHDSIRMASAICDETLASLRRLTGAEHGTGGNGSDANRNGCPSKCGHDAQAVRTACAIWLVSMDLQNDLATYSEELRARGLVTTNVVLERAILGQLTSSELLPHWRLIADVNYLPVIELGIECLRVCPDVNGQTSQAMACLHKLCEQLNALQTKHVYNFAGELWQRLVHDREERAAHYTKPHIAELLATLASERFAELPSESIGELKIMDAACGTGTLIGAGERAIRRRYWDAGGNDPSLHRKRMEDHIYAMDVNGIAGTLTAKRLTDLDLEQGYTRSQIAVITHAAGSLILLDPGLTGVSHVLGYQGVATTTGPGGDHGVFHVADCGIDWALMNPPYNRLRGCRRQATTGLKPFRDAAKRRGYGMSHGGAGLATDFGDLSNIRLRPGGVFSHVLPLTAGSADSWQSWRRQLETDFRDITVISATQSMSADTNIGELLVIATKQRGERRDPEAARSILFVNLNAPFSTLAEGYAIAREIARIPKDVGHGPLSIGTWSRVQQSSPGRPWAAAGGSSIELTAIVGALASSQAWDPDTNTRNELAIPMVTLDKLCSTGPTHHLIGHPMGSEPIGAFQWIDLDDQPDPPTQQSLWAADGPNQMTILTEPTHGGYIVDEGLANRMISLRSRWFIKRGMSMVSQSTAMAHTRNEVHGGRAWTALLDGPTEVMRAVALFHNSIFGGVLQTAYASIQQPGRAQLQVGAIGGLYCPAFNDETPEAQHARDVAAGKFNELSELELKPFAYCFLDENRHTIDATVAEMLGLDSSDEVIQRMLSKYRIAFARQPSVNGGRKSILDALKRYEKEHAYS